MNQERLVPWDDPEKLPGLIQKASDDLIAVREKLLAHINKRHPGQVLEGCHECPKIKVEIIEAQTEYNSLKSRLEHLQN